MHTKCVRYNQLCKALLHLTLAHDWQRDPHVGMPMVHLHAPRRSDKPEHFTHVSSSDSTGKQNANSPSDLTGHASIIKHGYAFKPGLVIRLVNICINGTV